MGLLEKPSQTKKSTSLGFENTILQFKSKVDNAGCGILRKNKVHWSVGKNYNIMKTTWSYDTKSKVGDKTMAAHLSHLDPYITVFRILGLLPVVKSSGRVTVAKWHHPVFIYCVGISLAFVVCWFYCSAWEFAILMQHVNSNPNVTLTDYLTTVLFMQGRFVLFGAAYATILPRVPKISTIFDQMHDLEHSLVIHEKFPKPFVVYWKILQAVVAALSLAGIVHFVQRDVPMLLIALKVIGNSVGFSAIFLVDTLVADFCNTATYTFRGINKSISTLFTTVSEVETSTGVQMSKLLRCHNQVRRIISSTAIAFSPYSAISIIIGLMYITLSWYEIIKLLLMDYTIPTALLVTILYINLMTTYNICRSCNAADNATRAAEATVDVFQKIPADQLSAGLQYEIQTFATSLILNKPEISVFGLFTVNNRMITSICGTIATYLIVLVQFRAGEGKQGSFKIYNRTTGLNLTPAELNLTT